MNEPNNYSHLIRPGLTDFYRQFISPGDLVFDLGANVGERTAVFLALNAGVICVEPDGECVAELKRLYVDNLHVAIIQMGVSNEVGSLPFYHNYLTVMSTFSEEFQQGYLGQQGHKWEAPKHIEVTTVDTLIRAFGIPKFCKIDVEGFESRVLMGLSAAVPALSFEFHQETLGEVVQCLCRTKQIGHYEYNFADGEAFTMALPQWVDENRLLDILYGIPNPHYRPFWGGDVYARLVK